MREWRIRVALVGAGPGRPDLITVRGWEWIARADVILYDRLVDPRLLDFARKECRKIFVGKECGRHTVAQQEIIRLTLDEAAKGNLVVRLKGGDPCVFGRGGEEAEALARAGFPFEIVPGVTAGVGVAAYGGVPLTHRLFSSSVTISTGQQTGTSSGKTCVFYMVGKSLAAAVKNLLASGWSREAPVLAVEAGTCHSQRSHVTTVGQLTDLTMESPILVIVGDVVRCRDFMNWFERRPLFGKRILVPRSREHRGKLAAILDEAGAEPVEFTPAAIEPVEDLSDAFRELDHSSAVHFGDPQSAGIFMTALRDARRLAGRVVSAAGHFTASTLERHGVVPDEVGPPTRSPVLWIGPGEIPEEVKALRMDVYREVPRKDERERVVKQDLHAVAFASSNSARRTVGLLGREFLGKIPLFSMGPGTSGELSRQGLDVAEEAEPSTFEGLVDVIIQHFSERQEACQESSIL